MLPAEVFCANCGAANSVQDTHCFACHQPLQSATVQAATQNDRLLRQRYHWPQTCEIAMHPGYNTMIRTLAWSPDGSCIAFGSHSKVQV